MSLGSLSLRDIFVNMSNAFVGILADVGSSKEEQTGNDATIKLLMKENRYMYLALLLLSLMIIGNVFYSTE